MSVLQPLGLAHLLKPRCFSCSPSFPYELRSRSRHRDRELTGSNACDLDQELLAPLMLAFVRYCIFTVVTHLVIYILYH